MASSLSRSLIASNSAFILVSLLSLILRIYARKQQLSPWSADDYLVIAAWIFSAALVVTNIVGVSIGGFGIPYRSLSRAQRKTFLKIFFVLQFWYIIAVALVKLSVLFLYGRLFRTSCLPISIKILLTLTVLWLVSFLFATFFQVWPIWCNWSDCPTKTHYPVIYAVCSMTDIFLDVTILSVPAFYIRKLQVSRSKRVGIIAIFGLGVFCIVSSIARLAYTVGFVRAHAENAWKPNFSPSVVNIIMWSGIEACASTICASLPCYSSLVRKKESRFELTVSNLRTKFSKSMPSTFRARPMERSAQRTTPPAANVIVRPRDVETVIDGSSEHYRFVTELEMGKFQVWTWLNRDG